MKPPLNEMWIASQNHPQIETSGVVLQKHLKMKHNLGSCETTISKPKTSYGDVI